MLSIEKNSLFFSFFNSFPHSWRVEISVFSIIFPIVQTQTPPLQCCWENVKKCQNFTYGYFDKNSKNTIINRETVFTKIFEKTRTYGDFDENFQKFAGRLRVKSKNLVKNGPALGRPILKISWIWKKRKSENLAIRKQEIQILINTNF